MPSFSWQRIDAGPDGPGPRSRHGLVHDRVAGATILFGGVVSNGGTWDLRSDTWELRNGHWSPVETSKSPPARHRGGMIFDESLGFAVLFGGQDRKNVLLGDTWTYEGHAWRERRSWWKSPEPRCGHSLAFDEESRQAVLFGGAVGRHGRSLGDTWTFDGSAWKQISGPGPSARRYASFAYDPNLRGCVLHGGSVDDDGVEQFGDAWLFRERAWTRLPIAFETDVRDDHGLAFHHGARALVMLDGLRGARGVLAASPDGWRPGACSPLHPRHQCSPLAWDFGLDGLVMHGGEVYHAGPQFSETLLLRGSP